MKQLFSFSFLCAFISISFSCAVPGTTCSTKADCASPNKPFCKELTGQCVGCIDDNECSEGFTCNESNQCEAGCRSSADRCTINQTCLAGVGCVECASDSQCGTGRICQQNQCVLGCSANAPNCPNGLVCNMAQGRCVTCVNSTQCTNAPTNICNPANQTCVECLGNSDCKSPGQKICDTSRNVCVGCIVNAQCAAGNVCKNSTCVAGCDASQPCPNGRSCNAGQCVQCTSDAQCGAATPRCNTATNTCVACMPGAQDNCPNAQYCRADFVCEQGCKSGANCPSGMCVNNSCTQCTADSQCAAGSVCNSGTCVAACNGTSNKCGAGLTCCSSGRCIAEQTDNNNCGACGNVCASGTTCCGGSCKSLDTVNNCGSCGNSCAANSACCAGACKASNTPQNCGACGVTCTSDQFCDGATCRQVSFPEFCANRNVYAIRDGIALDDAATNTLASTIQQVCTAQTSIQYGPQTNPAWVDQTTGAILLGGGSTIVTAGGPFPNKVTKWLERTNLVTKVYFASNNIDTFYFKKRIDNSIVVSRASNWCNPNRDVFVVELAAEPVTSSLNLISYGLCSPGNGTQTGAWYWANVMLPNRTQYADSWYLYEWIDTNNNGTAELTDTFTKLASGR
jgi:Cys-rich repeat protein